MKRITFLLSVICMLFAASANAQYNTTEAWGHKYIYNGSDYRGSFLKFKMAVANPRISGTGGQVVFYDSETSQYNAIQVRSVSQISDSRLKENIVPLNKGLGTILGLKPVSFTWKNETMNQLSANGGVANSLGFLAQDVSQFMPEIVTLSSTGDSLVDYTAMIPVLVQATREMNQTINMMQNEIDQLKSELNGQNQENATRSTSSAVAFLNHNTPNPFNSTTTIAFTIPASAHNAFISICNLQGTQVSKYNIASRGEGVLTVSATDLKNSGMYMYSLIVDGQLISTKRMFVTD